MRCEIAGCSILLYCHNMKTLKFAPDLCALIIAGNKTSTWRLFDEKNLQVGDVISCVNSSTLTPFGTAIISSVYTKKLGSLEETDWEGHERFDSPEIMYTTYRSYYGDRVGPDTEVKIVHFSFQKL